MSRLFSTCNARPYQSEIVGLYNIPRNLQMAQAHRAGIDIKQ